MPQAIGLHLVRAILHAFSSFFCPSSLFNENRNPESQHFSSHNLTIGRKAA
jgi:hypothetical protein